MYRIAACFVLSACGRLGFDLHDDVAGDAANDQFDPSAGNCVEAEAGPFVEVARAPTQGGGYGVWAAPPFVLRADTTGGFDSLRFDGTSFAEVDRLDGLGWVEAVWSDGTLYYVSAPGGGFYVVELAADGRLAVLAEDRVALSEARRGSVADGVIYLPTGPDGLHALRFDGTSIVSIGSTATLSWSQGVWARGSRVLLADGAIFRVVERTGSTFSDVVPPDNRHGGTRVWSDGGTIFVASADGATAYQIVGSQLIELATFTTPASARDIWSDGVHVFLADESGVVHALRFTGSAFAIVDQVTTGTQALGVFGDGIYIYTNDITGGLRAFTGFQCLQTK